MQEEKFTTKKDDVTIIGKLTEEELQIFILTNKLPDRIIKEMKKD